MATLIVSEILDALVAAVDAARAATTDARWTNALNAGYDWLLQQDVITFDADKHELTVNSPSGKTYTSNGKCQCDAFAQHNACWHRAAARLVRRALEAERTPAPRVLPIRVPVAQRLAAARALREVNELFA